MIDRIDATNTDSFKQHIADRQPCIISSIPEDLKCLGECTNLSFLEKHAGQANISVEPISSKGTFGTAATKQSMVFSDFLSKLRQEEQIYLTTQYTEELETAVLNEPLKTLRADYLKFPITPEHAGNMITAKVNIWLGASQAGTTSGLHHDFHDNFYILLSGRKKFRIFKPSWKTCSKLKINGKPHEIHENGLISYNATLGADGLPLAQKAQIRVELRERALNDARRSGVGIDEAEARYEEAMDQLLEANLNDCEGSEDGDFTDDADEDDDFASSGDMQNESGESAVDDHTAIHDLDRHGLEEPTDLETDQSATVDVGDIQATDTLHAPYSSSESSLEGSPRVEPADYDPGSDEPPSFSSLSSSEIAAHLQDKELAGQEFVLEKGELLYLPASYFHEVISMSGQQSFHMAINYWFFPPDGPLGDYADLEVADELRKTLMRDYASPVEHDTRPLKKRRTTTRAEGNEKFGT